MGQNTKLALITGGSEGIGLATAKKLFALGLNVVILSRNQEKLDKAKQEILASAGKSNAAGAFVEALSADVSDYESLKGRLEGMVDRHGIPDYLINCAGYAHPGYIDKIEAHVYKDMMNINYLGVAHTCHVLVPHFLRSGKKAHIVNTSSLAGFMGLFGYTGYCASKYAVVGFSQALAAELKGVQIKVSVLCPPNTKTPGLERENLLKPAEVLAMEEKAKVVTAEEVADVLVKGLDKNKFWLIPTLDGRLAHYLSRFAPVVLDQIIKRPSGN